MALPLLLFDLEDLLITENRVA